MLSLSIQGWILQYNFSSKPLCVFLFQSCPESAWQKDSKANTSHLQKTRQKWPALKPDNKKKPFCLTVRQESVTVFQHRSDFVCFSQAKHIKSGESRLISVKIPLKSVHHQWLRELMLFAGQRALKELATNETVAFAPEERQLCLYPNDTWLINTE